MSAFALVMKKLVLPPTVLILIGCVSFFALGTRWDGWARAGLALSLVGLYVLSTPVVGLSLLDKLESQYRQVGTDELAGFFDGRSDAAIVILDAGRASRGTEDETDDVVGAHTLERLAWGARIQRATGLPVLVSGNGAGALMADSLRSDFGVPTRWIESQSHDTAANARLSAEILKAEGFRHVILVTHAWHMPRSVASFQRTGLQVTAAPTATTGSGRQELGWSSFLPSELGMSASYWFYHETLGKLWYRLRYGGAP